MKLSKDKYINTAERISQSPNFINGRVKNLQPIKHLSKNPFHMLKVSYDIFFNAKKPKYIPCIKSNLKSLKNDCIIWFGHSSYMLHIDGKNILLDPLFSESASPISFINTPFSNVFNPSEIPNIDYLIITHNHYDHLSKKSIKALQSKISKAICPLGIAKYLKKWGIREVIEMDWNEHIKLYSTLELYCLTSRHFSGRNMFDSNKTLWASFLFIYDNHKIYCGCDGGYGKHFKEIGERFSNIDLAILENGQYSEHWANSHMFPNETLNAAKDLGTRILMPIHNSKYKISYHYWREPLEQLVKYYDKQSYGFSLFTPLIGEIVPLWDKNYKNKYWWEDLKE